MHVPGAQATPPYQRLTAATGVAPGWDFHQYPVSRDGRVLAQFPGKAKPDAPQLLAAIGQALQAPAPVSWERIDMAAAHATMRVLPPLPASVSYQEYSE